MKTFRTWTVHFVFSLKTEISLLTNEKKLKSSPGNGRTYYNLEDGATALAQLCALYSDTTLFQLMTARAISKVNYKFLISLKNGTIFLLLTKLSAL